MHVQQDQVGRLAANGVQPVQAAHRHRQLQLRALHQHAAHHFDVGLVVLDVVHPPLPVAAGRRRRRRRGGRVDGTFVGQRQPQHESRALAVGALGLQAAAHQFGQAAADGQPDAGALGAAALAAQPVEGLEQLGQLRGAQPQAGVGDADLQHARTVAAAVDRHGAAVDVVFHRVGQQVGQHLAQPRGVAPEFAGIGGDPMAQRDAARRRGALDHRDALLQQRGQPHRGRSQTQLAGLDARQVQRVVDHFQQVPAGLQHLGGPARLVWRQRRLAVQLEQLREAQHGVQRRSQLVAHARQELVLRPVRLFGQLATLLGLLQLQVLGDVFGHRQHALGPALRVAQQSPVHLHPQHRSVAVLQPGAVAQVGRRALAQSGQRPLDLVAVVGHRDAAYALRGQRCGVAADHLLQPRVGLGDAAVQFDDGDAHRGVVEDAAKALLAVAQRRRGALALGHFAPQLSSALGHRGLDAPGAAGHRQQQRGQRGSRGQPHGREQPGVAVACARHLVAARADLQLPPLAAQRDHLAVLKHAIGLAALRVGAACGAGEFAATGLRVEVDQAPAQVGGRFAHRRVQRLLQPQGGEHHAPERCLALRRLGPGLAAVQRAVDHHAGLVGRRLGQPEAAAGGRRIGGHAAPDRRACGGHAQRIDTQRGRVARHRLDEAHGDQLVVGSGRRTAGLVAAVEDAECPPVGRRHAGLVGGQVAAGNALAVAQRLQRGLRGQPRRRAAAELLRRDQAGTGEQAAGGLERVQRIAELVVQLVARAGGIAVELAQVTRVVPALDHHGAGRQQRGDAQQRQRQRGAAGRPVGARPADQRQRQRRGDQHAQRVAAPPGPPGEGDRLRRHRPGGGQHRGRQRGVDGAGQQRAQAEEHRHVARLAQRQRLPHMAANQPCAQSRLQCSAQRRHQRQQQRKALVQVTLGDQQRVDQQCAQRHPGQRGAAVDQHRGQRQPGRRVQRRGVARWDRQQQRQLAGREVGQRSEQRHRQGAPQRGQAAWLLCGAAGVVGRIHPRCRSLVGLRWAVRGIRR